MDGADVTIEVLSRAEAGAILCTPDGCADLAYLVSIGEAHNELPAGFDTVTKKLRLLFADTVAAEHGPTDADVRQIIALAERLRTARGRVLIHCEAGVSRSAAAAVIMYAVWLGPGRERDALARVLAQRPIATPNRRMLALADQLLDRGGRLVAVLG